MVRKYIPRALAAAVVAFPVAILAQASGFHFPTFDARTESVGGWPEVVVIADVTGDGRDDVVLGSSEWRESGVATPMSNKLFVHVQGTDGRLADPLVIPHGGDVYAGGILMQAGDLDRDGMADIVLSHPKGLAIAIATGGGTFSVRQVEIPLPRDFLPFYHALALGDLDGDGRLDIVRQMPEGGTLLLFGDGKGGVLETRQLGVEPGLYQKVQVEDADADGRVDLVMSSDLGVHVMPGLGDGQFDPGQVYPIHRQHQGYGGMAVVDVTRDGRRDIVVTTPSNLPDASLHVFEQQVDGTLAYPPRDVATYEIPETLLAKDLDHNGYDDLLVLHGGWMKLGFYLQDRSGLSEEHLHDVPYATLYSPHGLATGDVNGDGCTDVAVADYNHGLRVLHGRNCFEPWSMASDDPADFDGDGASDILWRNAATGHNVAWKSARSSDRMTLRRVADPAWRIAGTGDFDGDGRSDLFWRHDRTGRNAIWHAADGGATVAVSRVRDAAWVPSGIGDLDGDGRDDVVWRHRDTGANVAWEGGSERAQRNLGAVADIDWRIVGVADFDGDGRDDVLWRHRGDGRNVAWRGGDRRDPRAVAGIAETAWQVAGTGDFDGDGSSDVLWRHAFDGRHEIWHAADDTTRTMVARVSDLGWKIAAVGDYSGDGRADILWRNQRTGSNTLWRDGFNTRRAAVSRVANLKWKVVE